MKLRAGVVLTAVAALAAWPVARAEADAPGAVRRLVLMVGANDGGPAQKRLRFAVSDAQRMAQLLEQAGGVAHDDTILLRDPAEPALRAALADLRERVAAARGSARVEVIFYYSGHADDEGLLLRGTQFPFSDLRRSIESLGAEVRVAVIDSCASGALTRGKGGLPTAPFLVDASTRVTGQAILTSSSWNEGSQESDRIGGSFFTAALLTGLRGAADADHDGRVTLSEAYQFAFRDTLARTERSRGGPQHPSWDIQLAGSGDVVLTDLHGMAASLLFPADSSGRFFVRDAKERLVAELRKDPGQPLTLGLDPGRYRVSHELRDQLVEVEVEVESGPSTVLPVSGFTPVPRQLTVLRGDVPERLERRFIDVALFPPVSLNANRPTVNHMQLALVASRTTRLDGVGLGPVLWAEEDVLGAMLAGVGSSAGGKFTGIQLSGVASMSGELRGLQLSSVLNLARGDARGIQWSGVANWGTGRVTGLQSGPFNRADGLLGAQLGLVNLAGRVQGLQLGLVNVADHVDGAPVGLVSWVRDGEHKLLLLGATDGTAATELLLGSQHVHGLLRARVQPRPGEARAWVGYGLGVHLERSSLLLDLDGLAEMAPAERHGHVLATARILGGWQVTRWMAVVAGPSASFFWADRDFEAEPSGALRRRIGGGHGWLALQGGLRLLP